MEKLKCWYFEVTFVSGDTQAKKNLTFEFVELV